MKKHAILMAGALLAGAFAAQAQNPPLKDICQGHFLIGAALNDDLCSGKLPCEAAIVAREFDTCTPEDVLKWESVEPQPGQFNWGPPDRYVAFGETNHLFIVGHNLVWHHQTPDWVFKDAQGKTISRDALIQRMHNHIAAVVGRYKGRIKGWDVVNEAVDAGGGLRHSKWWQIIGPDYLVKAYQFAHEADPDAQLYYNEYDMELSFKRKGAIKLVKDLEAAGIQVAGIGIQGHYKINRPSVQSIDDAIGDLADQLHMNVMVTELDVDVLPQVARTMEEEISLNNKQGSDPWPHGLPPEMEQQLADHYAALFKVFLKHKEVSRVTFWGVTDNDSWLNRVLAGHRTNYPLIFGRDCQPKPAETAVVAAIQAAH